MVSPAAAARRLLSLYNPFLFELLEPLREQGGRSEWHATLEFCKARCAKRQIAQNERCPALAEDLSRLSHRAELSIALHRRLQPQLLSDNRPLTDPENTTLSGADFGLAECFDPRHRSKPSQGERAWMSSIMRFCPTTKRLRPCGAAAASTTTM